MGGGGGGDIGEEGSEEWGEYQWNEEGDADLDDIGAVVGVRGGRMTTCLCAFFFTDKGAVDAGGWEYEEE